MNFHMNNCIFSLCKKLSFQQDLRSIQIIHPEDVTRGEIRNMFSMYSAGKKYDHSLSANFGIRIDVQIKIVPTEWKLCCYLQLVITNLSMNNFFHYYLQPIYVYSEISSIMFNGTYSQVHVHRITIWYMLM